MTARRNITLYGLFSAFDSLDFFASIRVIYFFIITNSYSQAASLISLIWIFSALLEVPTGIFSDFIGRKKTMVVGAFCIFAGFILYAVGTDYLTLALGTFLHGAGRAFFSGNNNAYLYHLSKEGENDEKFSKYYGRINSLESSAAFIAALLSGFLVDWNLRNMMWICVGIQFLAFIVTILLKEVHSEKSETSNIYAHLKDSFREIKNNLNLRFLSLGSIFLGAGSAAYEFQAAVFSAVWPLWAVGIARAIQEIGAIPGYYFADQVIKRFGVVKIVLLQSWVSWAGNVLASILQSFLSPFLILSHFVFYGPADTATESLIQKEFTDRQRATISSLNSLGSSIYFAIVINLAGFIAGLSNPFLGLLTTQVFFLPVIYYRWKLFRRLR